MWRGLDPNSEVAALHSIKEAIDFVRNINNGFEESQIFVTGSFHLIGGALSILEGENFSLAKATAK